MRGHDSLREDLLEYLIGRLSGGRFEEFAKRLFSIEHHEEFVPLGGMHDGGADGLYLPGTAATERPDTFFQFSISGDPANKVAATIAALRKAGRDPKKIVYATSQKIPRWDVLADQFHIRFQAMLLVRDLERIKQSIQDSKQLKEFTREFFAAEISDLARQAAGLRGAVNRFVGDPTVFAFLDFELKDRFSRDQLYDRVLDSLIYWALRETDPETGALQSIDQIKAAVTGVFPSARKLLAAKLDVRLDELSKKALGAHHRIRAYKSKGLYCLSLEMREELAARNVAEQTIQDDFRASLKARIGESSNALAQHDVQFASELAFESVHEYFVEQGAILAAFLARRVEQLGISDQVVETIVERTLLGMNPKAAPPPEAIQATLNALRGVFYHPSDIERRYLEYVSRTSLLFFTLQTSPQLVEYFNQMAGHFRLIVGSDIVIKALSESYLEEENRQVTNLLKVLSQLGAVLFLSEPVLREVFTHLHGADLEFRNYYQSAEPYLTESEVAECDRILIRAYFYAKRRDGGPRSWRSYLNGFADPDAIRGKRPNAEDQLKGFLLQRYRMELQSWDDLDDGVEERVRDELAGKLRAARGDAKHEELSFNDAAVACAVYGLRRKHKETAIYDGFGVRTWWLTKETHILAYTADLVQQNGGVPYIMRPEFLLNYILLAPKAAEVRESFRGLLPTTVGLQLGRHLNSHAMETILDGVEQWSELPPERVSVLIQERVNKLKFDRYKSYAQKLDR
jgi:hypothetical protein